MTAPVNSMPEVESGYSYGLTVIPENRHCDK